jgi:antitoxin VapB
MDVRQVAKLFKYGRSQAVRLPSAFRFAGKEVFIRRDPDTGDVILSRRPGSWEDYFRFVDGLDLPRDFLSERDDGPPQERDLF